MNLWNYQEEIQFFKTELEESGISPEKLFYLVNDIYYAYYPKTYEGAKVTLQSRNSIIGNYTESWCKKLFEPVASKLGLYAVNNVVCEEVALPNMSSADLAFCTTKETHQKADNIKLIFEIKMSIVSNYKYTSDTGVELVGDYKSHIGNPSLLRSDSMLKAIGKAINIRVSGSESKRIPIVILGNSPITVNYKNKVDALKNSGVVQGFWSLNPKPCTSEYVVNSDKKGFITIDTDDMLIDLCENMLSSSMTYFSSMLPREDLGKIIKQASSEKDFITIASEFLRLLEEK